MKKEKLTIKEEIGLKKILQRVREEERQLDEFINKLFQEEEKKVPIKG